MKHLHIISHTHWDREWYRTFQQFRLQLVHLIDNLMVTLDNDPDYLHYMLDGQTIVLEDYLRVRMENFATLQKYVQENRILIGPWYILPDEFLVSPESTVRNLLVGKQICELFGQRMMIGYLPDPFGHIGQMPQILRGFGIDTAVLWRGVIPEMPTTFVWQAPDGSQVLLAHLYYGYGNVAHWPVSTLEGSVQSLDEAARRLETHSNTSHYLMMQGTDHLEPHPMTSEAIRFYNANNPDGNQAIHSTLPTYFAALGQEIKDKSIVLPVHIGELRDPQKAHMLPGVLSARMWIKQRNWKAQNDLERWSEPFSAWAEILERGAQAFSPITCHQSSNRVVNPGSVIREAWKTLMKNHTHDSICGCSIDETHRDMAPRFDKIDQINEEIRNQSLNAITSHINTMPAKNDDYLLAITVFNAAPVAATDHVVANISFPDDESNYKLIDEDGNVIKCDVDYEEVADSDQNTYTVEQLANLIEQIKHHGYRGKSLVEVDVAFDDEQETWRVYATLSDVLVADEAVLNRQIMKANRTLSKLKPDTLVQVFTHAGYNGWLNFRAKDIPAFGYKTYWLKAYERDGNDLNLFPENKNNEIENEWLKLRVDKEEGCFHLYDKRNGKHYKNLSVIASVGDRGDEYNFTPTEDDDLYLAEFEELYPLFVTGSQAIAVRFNMELPVSLDDATRDRSQETVSNEGFMIIELADDLPVVDIEFIFENQSADHRLELQFDLDFQIKKVLYDGHFDIVERPIDLPVHDESWSEHPRPEVPQRAFVDAVGEEQGLMIANQGLPEVSVRRYEESESSFISLTLLRSVGWLSRADLFNRRGHAGPGLPTPEAYELGETLSTRLRVIPHDGQSTEARQLAYAFQTDLIAVAAKMRDGDLPASGKMIEPGHPDFYISAIKEAEDQGGYIVRGYNQRDEAITVNLQTHLMAKSVAKVRLDEAFVEELALGADGTVHFEAKAKEIVTLYFKLKE